MPLDEEVGRWWRMEALLMPRLELGLGIRNAIKISCHILITPRGVLYFLYVVQHIRLEVFPSTSHWLTSSYKICT